MLFLYQPFNYNTVAYWNLIYALNTRFLCSSLPTGQEILEHFGPHARKIAAIAQTRLYCGLVYITIFILCSEPMGPGLLNHSPGEETTKGPLPAFFMNLKGLFSRAKLSQLQFFSINISYVYKIFKFTKNAIHCRNLYFPWQKLFKN